MSDGLLVWRCGTEERPWTAGEIEAFHSNILKEIDSPDNTESVAVPGDVEVDQLDVDDVSIAIVTAGETDGSYEVTTLENSDIELDGEILFAQELSDE